MTARVTAVPGLARHVVITVRIIGITIILIMAITVPIFGTVDHIMVIIIGPTVIITTGHIITDPGVFIIMVGKLANNN